MTTQITSREFNQDTSGAKKAAERGPVFITDRGRPAHVLLTFDAYEKLLGVQVLNQLAEPAGVEDLDLDIPVSMSDLGPLTSPDVRARRHGRVGAAEGPLRQGEHWGGVLGDIGVLSAVVRFLGDHSRAGTRCTSRRTRRSATRADASQLARSQCRTGLRRTDPSHR